MSIINEALKKAERERTRIPVGIPTQLPPPHMRRPWIRIAVAGTLVGATLGAGIGVWGWLLSGPSHVSPPRQARQFVASVVLEEGMRSRIEPSDVKKPPLASPVDTLQALAPAILPTPEGRPAVPPGPHPAAEAAFHKAVAAESNGLWSEAIGYYQEAVARRPTLREARTNLGNLYVRQNQLSAAIEQFQAALAGEPNYAVARNNLGSTYLLMGEEAKAIQEFLTAIRSHAHYVSPYYNLGSVYARRGDVDQAISFLSKAVTMEPEVLTWLQQDSDFDRIRTTRAFQGLYTQGRRSR